MMKIHKIEIILYVKNQQESTAFYAQILQKNPVLNVPGMTEFLLADNCKLGLMPNDGIAKILDKHTPHPSLGIGIPRCELYLHVDDIEKEFEHFLKSKAQLISPIEDRDWGDSVCYFSDLDGHIIALAQQLN